MISVTVFVGVITFLVFLFLIYVKWAQNYWSRRNVPNIQTTSIFGHVDNPFNPKRGLAFNVKDSYVELKRRGYKHGGIYFFTKPWYIPVDIDLVKCILAKDFQNFVGRGFGDFDEKKDPLGPNLFNLDGERWRNMRVKLTPTFTSGKMKMMFQTLVDCGVPMIEHIDSLCKNNEDLDIKEILACYTTDIIGSCAFGLECNSFKDPDADFRRHGRESLKPSFRNLVNQFFIFVAPALHHISPFKQLPLHIETFFMDAIKNVIDYRRTNNIKRNDFIQLFIEMQDKAKADNVEGITLQQIAAQSFLFFLGGFETSSTTMTFCLHELAFNQDIQDKLREEVRETLKRNNGTLTYDAIMGMKYMDQVVNETLRKYPPVPFLNRECVLDYKVPDTDVIIEKGTKVFISALGIQRDEEFYPNPDKFDPERFTEENKAKRSAYCFLPFGEGPRNCIGLRFGLMQTKSGLSMLLNKFKFVPAKTEKYDIDFEPMSFVLTKQGNILLNAKKVPDNV